ncbi:helix-turn-helix domain-containing protein [Streptococcus uberis]|uniref:helix-turn-helix domain-containing protein n=1 Tax=Streptococcus uberis TaxID=1349 RepID=UPI003D772DF5
MSENNFSKAIKESGFSKKEIAEKIGVNPRTLTRWEREESPIPYDKALEIARIINKSVSYLMGYMDKQDKYRSDELLIGNGKGGYTSLSEERYEELLSQYHEEVKGHFIDFLKKHNYVISDNEIKSVLLLISNLNVNSHKHEDYNSIVEAYIVHDYDLKYHGYSILGDGFQEKKALEEFYRKNGFNPDTTL